MGKCLFFILMLVLSRAIFASSHIQIYQGHKVTNDQQFPFVVALYPNQTGENFTEAYCTGSLIAPSWVLTASHCVFSEDQRIMEPSLLAVGFGFQARTPNKANKVIKIKKIFLFDSHPVWPENMQHDVALLQLSESVFDVKPVKLPSSITDFSRIKSSNQNAITVGYGFYDLQWPDNCETDPDNCFPDAIWEGTLLYGNDIIKPDLYIRGLLKKYMDLEHVVDLDGITYNNGTMLGATSPDGMRGTNGDSGGPLLIKDQLGDFVQVGITSWGLRPTYVSYKEGYVTKEPGVYVNLTNRFILDFINKTIRNNS